MSNDIRNIKYEMLIDDIIVVLNNEYKTIPDDVILKKKNYPDLKSIELDIDAPINKPLLLVYDYDKLNTYAKTILLKSHSQVLVGSFAWHEPSVDFSQRDSKCNYAKIFVDNSRNGLNSRNNLIYIFWLLFILAVDKTDYGRKLTLICDYAKLMRVSDNSVISLVELIKFIFHEVTVEELEKSIESYWGYDISHSDEYFLLNGYDREASETINIVRCLIKMYNPMYN